MIKSKYVYPDYWKIKINKNGRFWEGLFEGQPIHKNSVIINPVILNSYSNQHENAWAVYPNVESVIGFLKFIYLPTAFIGLLKDKQLEYQYYFQENLYELLDDYKEKTPSKIDLISKMEKHFLEIDKLSKETVLCLEDLHEWTVKFNRNWEEKMGISLSVNVLGSPKETVNFIIATYEEDLGIESLEDELRLSKSELLELASDEIYQNEFMKRKFTEIITNRLNVTF